MGFYEELDTGVRAVFAVLSAKERENSKHHCGTKEDGPNAFPVPDATHARNALARAHFSSDPAHVRACVARLVKSEGWDVEVQMGEPLETATALFSVPGPAQTAGNSAGDTDELEGLIFRCGEYPAQNFALSEAEADALIAAFRPVQARHGHPRSDGPLDGKMGVLDALWRTGAEIRGHFRVPKWLTALIPPEQRKLSLGFASSPAKEIAEWSWVTHPVISDAQLNAAFATFTQSHSHAAPAAKEQPMSWLDELRGVVSRAPVSGENETVTATVTQLQPVQLITPIVETIASGQQASTLFAQQQETLRVEREKLDQDRANFARTQFWAQAETRVAALIADRHIDPNVNVANAKGKPRLTTVYAEAYARDAAGTAIFAESLGGSLVAELDAIFGALTVAVDPTKEAVQVLTTPATTTSSDGGMTPQRYQEIMSQGTELHQKALALHNGNGQH